MANLESKFNELVGDDSVIDLTLQSNDLADLLEPLIKFKVHPIDEGSNVLRVFIEFSEVFVRKVGWVVGDFVQVVGSGKKGIVYIRKSEDGNSLKFNRWGAKLDLLYEYRDGGMFAVTDSKVEIQNKFIDVEHGSVVFRV